MTTSTAPDAVASQRQSIPCPPPPRSPEDLGLPFSVVSDLLLRILYFNGSLAGRELAAHICIPFPIVEPALKHLSDEAHISTAGMRTSDLQAHESLTAGTQWQLTTTGRQRARELIEVNQYAGPAPVPIDVYTAVARHQAKADVRVTRDQLRAALAHLILSDVLHDELGPAISARHTVFLYGPPGNGKTSIADACADLLGPPLFVPRALYAHGEIIRFFDPVVHHPVSLPYLPPHDTRWVPVRRPAVKVGGELRPEQLDLGYDQHLGFHEASLQLKANGGMFLVDDFGRQTRLPPHELLNRLIVPLEKGVDYLNLPRAGTTLTVPFTTTVILSTNLRPDELMDEAFLRRIRFKVFVPSPTEEQFRAIWHQVCARMNVPYDDAIVTALIEEYYREPGREFRGVHPRDLLTHVVHAAQFEGRRAELAADLLDVASNTYFVRKSERW
ncbi:MAG TPA: ATP-binding protein [Candidatus Dormibacteraeota bacterium]|nr:ATP-binding protein [Candidatus Dormibacteraeota bacterium]